MKNHVYRTSNNNPVSRLISRACLILAGAVLGCADESSDPASLAGNEPAVIKMDQAVVSRLGLLVFQDERALHETLTHLGSLDNASIREWNRSMHFVSLRQIFDEVVEAEAAISDYYEQLVESSPEGASLLPKEPVHSEVYQRALQGGQLRLIREDEGDYFDYNIRDTHLAPVLDLDGRVAVGGVLLQYGPEGVKQTSYESLDDIDRALVALADASFTAGPFAGAAVDGQAVQEGSFGTQVIPYREADWIHSSGQNNAWAYYGTRRYRAWVEGNSYRQWDSLGRQELRVRNVLRIQGMKRNIFGSWGFRETYTTYVNIDWFWQYLWGNQYYWDNLPVPSYSASSPMSWSSSYVNDATLRLSPHIDGYYLFHCTSCATVEPVVVEYVAGTVVINGVTLYPGAYSVINMYY